MAEYIEAKGKAPLVKPLFDHYYYGYYKNALPHLKGSPFHDTMPILALLDNSMFTYHKSPIVVMTESSAQGASIGEFRSLVNQNHLLIGRVIKLQLILIITVSLNISCHL